MKLNHLIVAIALIVPACSNQPASESSTYEAEAASTKSKVKHDRPQSVDLTKYEVYQADGAAMKIKIDLGTEKSCWTSAMWRVKQLASGDYYVTVETLMHPMMMCSPNQMKTIPLGTEIDIPANSNGYHGLSVFVQRLENPRYARSLAVDVLKSGSPAATVDTQKVEAEGHFISIDSISGFTAFIDYKRVRACWPDYFYTKDDLSEGVVLVQASPAMHIAVPCTAQHLKTFNTGIKFEVKNGTSLNYKTIIVTKNSGSSKFPVVSAKKN